MRPIAGRSRSPGAGVRTAALALAVWATAPPLRLASQQAPATARIAGRLVDRQSRAPVGSAQIVLLGRREGLSSDSAGLFVERGLAPGRYVLEARAVGYRMGSWVVQARPDSDPAQVFELERLSYTLDPVTVERRPSFAEERRRAFDLRRASGRGSFITEAQIEATHPSSLADLLRDVPGVQLECRGGAGCIARMARTPRGCRPDFVLDGLPATYSTSLDMPTTGIIGIEVYRTVSETPLEFLKADNLCGTIVIWTRSGPPTR